VLDEQLVDEYYPTFRPSRKLGNDEQLICEYLRARFYEHYLKEYDRKFMKKRDEDQNRILILVCLEGDTCGWRGVMHDGLRPHIPASAWDWLKSRPVSCPNCQGLTYGTENIVVLAVQQLRDVKLTTSYFFVV